MDLRSRYPDIHISLVMPGVVTTDFAQNAGTSALPGGAPRRPAGPMRPQTPGEVAEKIAELIQNPVAEIYTNPASAQIAQEYYAGISAFEEALAKRQS